MCLMHSEAKQTETLEFGAKKGLLQGPNKEYGSLYARDPNSPMVFREEFLKANFGERASGCIPFFLLVGGEVNGCCFKNLNHQPSGCN